MDITEWLWNISLANDGRPLRTNISEESYVIRLRTIRSAEELLAHPVTPAELSQRAAHFCCLATDSLTANECVTALLPWMTLWTNHPKWRTGHWRCQITDGRDHYSTGELSRYLAFHSDMTRYTNPPQFTVIRCVATDVGPGAGGATLLLHVGDIATRLVDVGRTDILEMLRAPRTLLSPHSPHPLVQMLPEPDTGVPVRIFDFRAATNGRHLQLSSHDLSLLDEFQDICLNWDDLIVRVPLRAFEVLAFSNHQMVHARTRCSSLTRITDICLGNPPLP
jgi:hypothetical protein